MRIESGLALGFLGVNSQPALHASRIGIIYSRYDYASIAHTHTHTHVLVLSCIKADTYIKYHSYFSRSKCLYKSPCIKVIFCNLLRASLILSAGALISLGFLLLI